LAWQLLFPFRHFLYPGNPSWTEEGHHFAWHMMLREKDVGIRFYVRNPETGARGRVQVSSFLNYRQLSRMGKDSDMILQFVHYVRDHYRAHGKGDLEIHVLDLVSLNGRKPQLMLDPNLDYTKVERVWGHQPWIVPLTEPFRAQGWNMPLEEWEEALDLDLPEEIFGSAPKFDAEAKESHTGTKDASSKIPLLVPGEMTDTQRTFVETLLRTIETQRGEIQALHESISRLKQRGDSAGSDRSKPEAADEPMEP
jgi:hypothetical protein